MAKRKRVFASSPLRALMKNVGAEIVARAAVEVSLYYLEERAKELTDVALRLAKHSKRKKITADDMKLAIRMV